MTPERFDESIQEVSDLGELLALTLNLIYLYGESAPVYFTAGYNNVESFVLSPPLDVVTGEPVTVYDHKGRPIKYKKGKQ